MGKRDEREKEMGERMKERVEKRENERVKS